MKTSKYIIFLMLLTIGTRVCPLQAQSRREKKEREEQTVKELVESKSYRISVSTTYPCRGHMIPLTLAYSVVVRNDSVFSQLPYFGRAYSIPYEGGQELMLKAPINKYNTVIGKRGAAKINFTARNPKDQLKFRITIYSNGSPSIDAGMQNRESVSFSGDLILPD